MASAHRPRHHQSLPLREVRAARGVITPTTVENIDIGGPAMDQGPSQDPCLCGVWWIPPITSRLPGSVSEHEGALPYDLPASTGGQGLWANRAYMMRPFQAGLPPILDWRRPIGAASPGNCAKACATEKNPHQRAGFYLTGGG